MDHADRFVTADLEAVLPRLRRYARVLVGGTDGADDLVARTLAGAWRRPRLPASERDLLTSLFGLMRAVHRREADNMPPSGRPSGTDMCARVLRLPIEEREVLLLVAVERLSYAAIADLLDLPVATVTSTLTRARERLCAMERDDTGSSHIA